MGRSMSKMQEFFSGWPVAKTLPSNAESDGLITGQEAKIPLPRGQKTKTYKTEATL